MLDFAPKTEAYAAAEDPHEPSRPVPFSEILPPHRSPGTPMFERDRMIQIPQAIRASTRLPPISIHSPSPAARRPTPYATECIDITQPRQPASARFLRWFGPIGCRRSDGSTGKNALSVPGAECHNVHIGWASAGKAAAEAYRERTMSTIVIAILVLLLLGSISGYCGCRREIGTGLANRLGLMLVGPSLAAALWCLWWST